MSLEALKIAWEATSKGIDKLVHVGLADHANVDLVCWPSIGRIGRRCGLHRTSVMRALKNLERDGHIVVERINGKGSRYRLIAGSAERPVAESDRSLNATTPVAQSDHTGSGKRPHRSLRATRILKEPINEPIRKDSLPDSCETESEAEIRQTLMLVQAKWPDGCGHEDWGTAERLIRDLVKGGETLESIETGVARYSAYCKATGRYVSNPGKWFAAESRPWKGEWKVPPNAADRRLSANRDAAARNEIAWAEAECRAKAIGFREPHPLESAEAYMTDIKNAENLKPTVPISERLGLSGLKRPNGGTHDRRP